MRLHNLSIVDGVITLDDFAIKYCKSYQLSVNGNETPELTVTIYVEHVKNLETYSGGDDAGGNLGDDIEGK